MKPISMDDWPAARKEIVENVFEGKGPMLTGYVPKPRPMDFKPMMFRPTDMILQLVATIDSLLVNVKWTDQ